jgi:hypothetical protein
MSDPRRWLDDDQASRSTVDLLRALEPPKAAPAAVRRALAKELTAMVATSGTRAAAGIGWLKLTVLSVAVVGAGGGATVWSLHRSPARTISPSHVEVAGAPPEVQAPSSADVDHAGSPMAPSENAENDLPASAAETASANVADRPHPSSVSSVPPAEPRDRLAEEEALLEQARKLLAQDPARALTLLHRHQSRFPNGELTAERMYLGVDCLSRLGKQAAAKREADALVERYPNSAYARRAPLLLAAPAR